MISILEYSDGEYKKSFSEKWRDRLQKAAVVGAGVTGAYLGHQYLKGKADEYAKNLPTIKQDEQNKIAAANKLDPDKMAGIEFGKLQGKYTSGQISKDEYLKGRELHDKQLQAQQNADDASQARRDMEASKPLYTSIQDKWKSVKSQAEQNPLYKSVQDKWKSVTNK